ncbi:respiratory nitrate reductase subunit gamma [Candidatus Thioglobus sp.]|nr:respiratory nitrate reductase subunit gamma [Candidatus Thioglobus sp.]
MSLTSIIFTLFCYLSLLIFVIGLSYKIIQYSRTPAPLKIPIAPAPLKRSGVFMRMVAEVFLFKSLFKASKWTWFFGWIFHWALVLLFIRHLGYFWPGDTPEVLLKTESFKYASFPLIIGLMGLLARRIFVDRIRYISSPSDYLMLILLITIGASGMLMTFALYYPNMGLVYSFAEGLVTLNWSELPSDLIFLVHIFFVFILIAIFPISKLLHAPGVFFSPTLNQVDNARKRRHISSWAMQKETDKEVSIEQNLEKDE